MNDMVVLKKLSDHPRAEDLIQRMSGKATVKTTTDEIMNLTRTYLLPRAGTALEARATAGSIGGSI